MEGSERARALTEMLAVLPNAAALGGRHGAREGTTGAV